MLRILTVLILLVLSGVSAHSERPLTVFAAASMKEAMERIGTAFETRTGTAVVFSFAGTGILARQIEAGAPADLFVSADTDWMDYAADRGAVRADSIRRLAGNSLVLVGPAGSAPLALNGAALAGRLAGERMAIADPDTVPAGRYGRAALETLGLWGTVESQLASMENVRVALASVARGDTPLGLVYGTDAAVEPGVTVVANLPEESAPAIVYPAAVTTVSEHPQAEAFLEFLGSPEARKVLRSLGFLTDKMD